MQRLAEAQHSNLVIGAGPVGSMVALLLATVFPDRAVDVFEKRHGDVRGHGLDIHAETIKEMNLILKEIEHDINEIFRTHPDLPRERRVYYRQVLHRINITKNFLKKEVAGRFIRTGKISEMAQDLAKELGDNIELKKNLVNFHLDTEITDQDILGLANSTPRDPSIEPSVKQTKLAGAEFIFAADGAHSKIRERVLKESEKDVRKNELSYLLEIKLQMHCPKQANKTLDKLIKGSRVITNAEVTIWNEGADGTSTLHVFISKEMYDALHVKDAEGKFLAEFVNPYRRLIDLPRSVREYVQDLVTNVIGETRMDASSIKITVLPLLVYMARKLLITQGDKIVCLVGDAAVGLALARGVNNGFYSTARYVQALFKESLIDEFYPEHKANFKAYTQFWTDQRSNLEDIIQLMDVKFPVQGVSPANRQVAILNKFDEIFESLLKLHHLSPAEYRKKVTNLQNKFYQFLTERDFVNTNAEIPTLRALTENLFAVFHHQEKMQAMKLPELYKCQSDIFARANRKINDAKFEVNMVNKVRKVGKLSTKEDIDYALDHVQLPPVPDPVNIELNNLHTALKKLDLLKNPEYSQWVFKLDCMYIALARNLNAHQQALIDFIKLATKYVNNLPSQGPIASSDFKAQAARFIDKKLAKKIVNAGNYLFSSVRLVANMNTQELIKRVQAGVEDYINGHSEHLPIHKRVFDAETGQFRAESYEALLSDNSLAPDIKLAVILALFNNEEAVHLRRFVLESVLGNDLGANLQQVPLTELDSQAMREVMQNKLAQRFGTQKIRALRDQAYQLMLKIDNKKMDLAFVTQQFNTMLKQLRIIQSTPDETLLKQAFTAISRHYNELRILAENDFYGSSSCEKISAGSIGKLMRFDPTDYAYLPFLNNQDVPTSIRLAVLCAVLTNKKTLPKLKDKIVREFFNEASELKLNQAIEAIELRLTKDMDKEQIAAFKSNIFKLVTTLKEKGDITKATKPLLELFQLHAFQNCQDEHIIKIAASLLGLRNEAPVECKEEASITQISLFKIEKIVRTGCTDFLQDHNVSNRAKLAVVYALLTSDKSAHSKLKNSLLENLVGVDSLLRLNQVVDTIEARVFKDMNKEQIVAFKLAMPRLVEAVRGHDDVYAAIAPIQGLFGEQAVPVLNKVSL